jgi:hypothetical protein
VVASFCLLPHPHAPGLQGRSAGQRAAPPSTSRQHQEPRPRQRSHERFPGLVRAVLGAGGTRACPSAVEQAGELNRRQTAKIPKACKQAGLRTPVEPS